MVLIGCQVRGTSTTPVRTADIAGCSTQSLNRDLRSPEQQGSSPRRRPSQLETPTHEPASRARGGRRAPPSATGKGTTTAGATRRRSPRDVARRICPGVKRSGVIRATAQSSSQETGAGPCVVTPQPRAAQRIAQDRGGWSHPPPSRTARTPMNGNAAGRRPPKSDNP